jgi:hypothetical protein
LGRVRGAILGSLLWGDCRLVGLFESGWVSLWFVSKCALTAGSEE